ncbi:hypothetical protein [Nocardioides sp. Root140]|uniref:hypothetical protein n=1 Tax=Nocardioides sp. Root140 TaxID=1736460 RepID=UPI0006FC4CD9|nr:hypothetical protein [Nocardioides sp. Root140]KQY61839.1 hypothetical protein ASD30_25185 [Nocardioides sp. Root140]
MNKDRLHRSPDGVYRKCQIQVEGCPFEDREHVTITQLAMAGGATVNYGHGDRKISRVVEGVFMVEDQRKRWYRVNGQSLSGGALRAWKRLHLEYFLEVVAGRVNYVADRNAQFRS